MRCHTANLTIFPSCSTSSSQAVRNRPTKAHRRVARPEPGRCIDAPHGRAGREIGDSGRRGAIAPALPRSAAFDLTQQVFGSLLLRLGDAPADGRRR